MNLNNRIVDVPTICDYLGIEEVRISSDNRLASCPWPERHNQGDSHPSFAIHLETGLWLCQRGCGKGNLVQLVQQLLQVEREDAVEWIIGRASGDIPNDLVDRVIAPKPLKDADRENIYAIASADYGMMRTKTISSYIFERGFTKQSIRKWGIRYDANLNALVIPIVSRATNQVVGVGRRLIPPIRAGYPKYMFTKGFDKNSYLFGEHLHYGDDVILVEGLLDAIWLHQHGYTTAVALMGVQCSEIQIDRIKELGRRAVLALDGDEAGRGATEVIYEQLIGIMPVQIVDMPDGKDAQDLLLEELNIVLGLGKYAWEKCNT